MDFSTIYRLKTVSEDAFLFFEDNGPYEHIEKSVLFWEDRLCIETYESNKGPDYDIIIKFYLYDPVNSKKLVENFGGLDGLYEELRQNGVNGEFGKMSEALGISPQVLYDNPFVK